MNTYAKFATMVAVIIGVLVWLAMGGISDSKTYYKTIAELGQIRPKENGFAWVAMCRLVRLFAMALKSPS